jgi:cell wall-associated NlpC family hydrolase
MRFRAGTPRLRRGIAAGAAVLFAGGLATGIAQLAGAAPQPSVSQVQAQVNDLQAKFDKAVQQYDQVNTRLTAAKSRLAQVNKQLAAASAKYEATRKRVVQIAAATYMDSGQTSLAGLLTTSNPGTVLNQASILTQLTGTRNAQVKVFLTAAQQFLSVQQAQAHTEAGIQQLANQRAATKNSIQSDLNKKKALLSSLTAQQQQQVATGTVGGGSSGSVPATQVTSGKATNAQAAQAVAYVLSKVQRCWYHWGATGPCSVGYDCSGLVMAAWASAGVSIPRDTYSQWGALPHISLSALQPGDLIYYNGIGHVAMFVGNGMIVDAPQTGKMVQEMPYTTSWYYSRMDGAVRP